MATYYDEEERKKGGFWGKFLAVLLGFLFGIIATIGSIAAIGYALFAKIKIKDGISSVNKITGTDIDYKEYITDEYAEKTISALLSDLSSLVSEFQGGKGSLSSLNKISPQVETQVTKIADTLQADYNIPLTVNSPHKDAEGNILDEADNVIIDKDGNVVKQDGNGNAILTGDDGEMLVGLMDVPLSQLAPFVTKSMEPIELGAVLASKKIDMLQPDGGNYELMALLCYGDKDCYETKPYKKNDNIVYKTDEKGNIVKDENGNPVPYLEIVRDENGKAVMKNGAKATTVGDFLSGEGGEGESGGVVSILEKISVAGLLDATDSLDESNALVRALLYETDTYALDDENAFTAPDGTKYTYDAEAGQWTDGKGGRIQPVSAPPESGGILLRRKRFLVPLRLPRIRQGRQTGMQPRRRRRERQIRSLRRERRAQNESPFRQELHERFGRRRGRYYRSSERRAAQRPFGSGRKDIQRRHEDAVRARLRHPRLRFQT